MRPTPMTPDALDMLTLSLSPVTIQLNWRVEDVKPVTCLYTAPVAILPVAVCMDM